MIVFYTRFHVVETFDVKALLAFSFECVKGMRNAPNAFKNVSWDDKESGEWKSERNLLAYEIDSATGSVAFRVAIVDQNDELWTTDIALSERLHEIQLRLAREKRIVTAEYDKSFNIPYIFKKIIREGIGGMDSNLPVTDKPIYIDTTNLTMLVNIINRNTLYDLPVIYVSHPFNGLNYELDIDELAKDMAGSAHVLVEKESGTSIVLKEMTDSKNAYNGAIDIFYNDSSFRYLKWPEVTSNQFRYKISHAVYSRMAMRNIDDMSSLSSIRLRNKTKKLTASDIETQKLSLRVDELEERYKEAKEYFEYASDEIKALEKRINGLENENYELKNKVSALTDSLRRKQGKDKEVVSFEFSEESFYEDEIKRIILECIKNTVSTYGSDEQKRRDYHVLTNIIDINSCSETGDTIKQEMLRIIKKNKLNKADVSDLRGLGFEIQKGGHDKYIFHGDDRYIITVSNSPSDFRDGENLAHDAVNLIFGRT